MDPKLTWGLPTSSLTTNSSWLPWLLFLSSKLWCQYSSVPITRQRKVTKAPKLAGMLPVPRLTIFVSSKVKGQGHYAALGDCLSHHLQEAGTYRAGGRTKAAQPVDLYYFSVDEIKCDRWVYGWVSVCFMLRVTWFDLNQSGCIISFNDVTIQCNDRSCNL